MKSEKLVIVPASSVFGKFTQGRKYDVVRTLVDRNSVRAYYNCDLGGEFYAFFNLSCLYKGNLRNGAKSMFGIWEARLVEVEQPLSEIDQIISTAQHYAKEAAKRAIADAMLPGGQIHAALRAGGPFINDAFIRPGHITVAPTEHTAKTDREVLEVLRDTLRVPEGEDIITHAKAVRVMADALKGIANQ